MKKIALALAALLAASTSAVAADIYAGSKMQPAPVEPAAHAAPTINWAGLEVGIQGGYTVTEHHVGVDVAEKIEDQGTQSLNVFDLDSFGGDGFSGRVSLEYKFRLGGDWYAGPRLYYGLSDDTSSVSVGFAPGVRAGIEVKGTDYYGGDLVLGRAVGGDRSTLIFGTVGYRVANYDLSGTGQLKTADISTSKEFQGLTFGGGVRHAFTSHLVGSVEYTHFQAGEESWAKFGEGPFSASINDKLSTDTVEVGLHYHF